MMAVLKENFLNFTWYCSKILTRSIEGTMTLFFFAKIKDFKLNTLKSRKKYAFQKGRPQSYGSKSLRWYDCKIANFLKLKKISNLYFNKN